VIEVGVKNLRLTLCYVTLPEVAIASKERLNCVLFDVKMHSFTILLQFLCVVVLFREIHCLYEDQAGLFDWYIHLYLITE